MKDRQAHPRPRAAGMFKYIVADKGSAPRSDAYQAEYDVEDPGSPSADAMIHVLGCGSLVPVTDLTPGEVVLDLGCRASLDHLVGIEAGDTGRAISRNASEKRIRRLSDSPRAVGAVSPEVRCGMIAGLTVADDSVDWVLSNCVFSLLPDRRRAFHEVARVLKPGGRIRVAGIVAEGLPDWVRHSPILRHSSVAGAATEQDYQAGLRSTGLWHVALGGRYVYDSRELAGLLATKATPLGQARWLADAVVGQVWSVQLSARKPPALEGRPNG